MGRNILTEVSKAHNAVPDSSLARVDIINNRLIISKPTWSDNYIAKVIPGIIVHGVIQINPKDLPKHCDRIAVVDLVNDLIIMGDFFAFIDCLQGNTIRYVDWKRSNYHTTRYEI